MRILVYHYGALRNQLTKEIIDTPYAPKAIGVYSQGIKINNLVYTSGQIPINPNNGKLIENDIIAEINQVLNNLDAILKKGGSSLDMIIKMVVFITDISLFPQINEAFKKKFSIDPPARSVVEVSALPMDARVEIEAIALIT